MSAPVVISDVWWWYYPTSYGVYQLQFHFAFLVGPEPPQMISYAFVTHVGDLDDFAFYPGFQPDQSSTFFHDSKYPIP